MALFSFNDEHLNTVLENIKKNKLYIYIKTVQIASRSFINKHLYKRLKTG